ncbi:hypothetical protein [Cacatuid alphaherpesvirus 2]|uniref:Uncharacterized protein n=1 Tax=Cacatuid alphaherpesvirus 2 TaxID=2604840 RepID=A0A5B9R2G2_9ALPH|nr:hypothetical protein QKT46_gp78 [Cacatuid alphaherpesvirus 2]QEG54066.1 hypothetical protein [Cacatuid alphaherpesvirus 2]
MIRTSSSTRKRKRTSGLTIKVIDRQQFGLFANSLLSVWNHKFFVLKPAPRQPSKFITFDSEKHSDTIMFGSLGPPVSNKRRNSRQSKRENRAVTVLIGPKSQAVPEKKTRLNILPSTMSTTANPHLISVASVLEPTGNLLNSPASVAGSAIETVSKILSGSPASQITTHAPSVQAVAPVSEEVPEIAPVSSLPQEPPSLNPGTPSTDALPASTANAVFLTAGAAVKNSTERKNYDTGSEENVKQSEKIEASEQPSSANTPNDTSSASLETPILPEANTISKDSVRKHAFPSPPILIEPEAERTIDVEATGRNSLTAQDKEGEPMAGFDTVRSGGVELPFENLTSDAQGINHTPSAQDLQDLRRRLPSSVAHEIAEDLGIISAPENEEQEAFLKHVHRRVMAELTNLKNMYLSSDPASGRFTGSRMSTATAGIITAVVAAGVLLWVASRYRR